MTILDLGAPILGWLARTQYQPSHIAMAMHTMSQQCLLTRSLPTARPARRVQPMASQLALLGHDTAIQGH